jgi:hypothetical protein
MQSTSMSYDSFELYIESIERALQAPNLHEEFFKLTHPGGEDMIIGGKAGHIVYSDTGGDGPESR